VAACDAVTRPRRAIIPVRSSDSTPWLMVTVACLAALGCGPRDTRVECSGTVSYAGQPVEEGSIGFFPLAGGGRSEGAVITAGRYTARVQPGRHRVEIRGSRPLAGKAIVSDMPGGIREDYIPREFNEASKLEVEIPATGPHTLPFDLPAGR
jgi:hypothetical protein